eukprot:3470459-Pyramimonas_sp.AAC.1
MRSRRSPRRRRRRKRDDGGGGGGGRLRTSVKPRLINDVAKKKKNPPRFFLIGPLQGTEESGPLKKKQPCEILELCQSTALGIINAASHRYCRFLAI